MDQQEKINNLFTHSFTGLFENFLLSNHISFSKNFYDHAMFKVGIIDIAYSIPKQFMRIESYVKENEKALGGYRADYGIIENGVPSEDQNCISMAKEALENLMIKSKMLQEDIGRLEVGSGSNPDSAKSIKTHLMSYFTENKSISGADNIQACYGGTAALLNSLAWAQSNFSEGKYAIVVCTDCYFYDDPSLYPLSSGGAVALLVGRNPVFEIEEKMTHYFDDYLDFQKPKKIHPKTIIDGNLFLSLYMKSFERCYKDNSANYHIFHTPFPNLIRNICSKNNIKDYEASLKVAERNGNPYTASVYLCLISLLSKVNVKIDDIISVFSFGSGCSSSLFFLKKVREGCEDLNIERSLNQRTEIGYEEYIRLMESYFKN